MVVHLIDGTYELFRQFYGPRAVQERRRPARSARWPACCSSVLQMIEGGATHIGVATDHVIESFRNELWPGYKTGAGIEPALRAQFEPLEEALDAMGVAVWPMVELEADDALASAARIAAADAEAEQVCIWTPDKDLAQCVQRDRVVQVDRRDRRHPRRRGVREKFGVDPARIPDLLALVGDSADGYPGDQGHRQGRRRADDQPVRRRSRTFPPEALADERRELALLFKDLATLRSGEQLFAAADDLRWRGPAEAFADVAERLGDERLLDPRA